MGHGFFLNYAYENEQMIWGVTPPSVQLCLRIIPHVNSLRCQRRLLLSARLRGECTLFDPKVRCMRVKTILRFGLLLGAMMLPAITSRAQTVTKVAAGATHSLFIKSDGSLWAMGYNVHGELGNNTYVDINQPQMIVSSGVTAVAAAFFNTYFVKSNGTVWAMGANDAGQLGNGIFYNRTIRHNRSPSAVSSRR